MTPRLKRLRLILKWTLGLINRIRRIFTPKFKDRWISWVEIRKDQVIAGIILRRKMGARITIFRQILTSLISLPLWATMEGPTQSRMYQVAKAKNKSKTILEGKEFPEIISSFSIHQRVLTKMLGSVQRQVSSLKWKLMKVSRAPKRYL